jgi:mono/diheme cytochrome c family protein
MSLAADVTPPPGYRPAQNAPDAAVATDQPAAVVTAFPLVPPDPNAGKSIYLEKCEPCHGPTGLGDGSKAGSLPERPPLIGSRALALDSRPADWFRIVTEGNLEKLMPGFKVGLDDRQRWDVVAYVFSLSQSPEELASAGELYTAECASCHGPEGRGDGEKAAGLNVPDWSRQDRLALLSAQEIAGLIASGNGGMPAFGSLDEESRLALVFYLRSLTYLNVGSQSPAAPDAPSQSDGDPQAEKGPQDTTLVIRGKVVPQTEDITAGGVKLTLVGYEGMEPVLEMETISAADGSYEFSLDNKNGMAYMVQAEVNDYTFVSDILHSQDAIQSPAELPLTIYATTTDSGALTVDRMHIFFDFSMPQTVQVVELFIISNNGGAVVVAADGQSPVLTFRLPEGASNLQFEGGALGDRFIEVPSGFGDLAAIGPGQGQHQVLFSYSLPYDRKLDLSIPVPLGVASALVMVPQGGVRVQSDLLQAAGSRDVQGMTFELFTGTDLSAGSELNIKLSGKVRGAEDSSGDSLTGVLIGAGALGLVLIGTGVWLFRRRMRRDVAEPESADQENLTVEGLLDAILALDDLHQAGKLAEAAYQERRAGLKALLKELKGDR